MIRDELNNPKAGMQMGILMLLVWLVSGCAALPGGGKNIALDANRLTVKVRLNQPAHKAQARYPYGLYRLVENKVRLDRYAYRYRPGIVRLAGMGRGQYYLVEPRPVAVAQPVENRVTFELPILESQETCYAVVSMGSFAMSYSRFGNVAETHFIDLEAYHDYASRLKGARALKVDLENSQRGKQILLSKIDSARSVLAHNRAHVQGKCILPEMGPLPKRPRDAYPYDEAKAIAYQVVFQYFADRIGCHAMKGIFKGRSFKRFLDQFSCGDKRYLRYLRRNEYSVLLDLVEALLLNCHEESRDNCMALYAGIVATRALSSIDEITNRLHAPYRSWQEKMRRIRSEPLQTQKQCSVALAIWSNREHRLAAADNKIATGKERVANAEKEMNDHLTRSAVDLVCHEDPRRYVSTDRGAVFVSPR